MKTHMLKALVAVSLAAAGFVLTTSAHAADATPYYISPGIGTMIISWFSFLM